MDQNSEKIISSKMSVKVSVSAKGVKYGEYKFSGDTEEELKKNGETAKKLYNEHTADSFIVDKT